MRSIAVWILHGSQGVDLGKTVNDDHVRPEFDESRLQSTMSLYITTHFRFPNELHDYYKHDVVNEKVPAVHVYSYNHGVGQRMNERNKK